MPTYDYRCTDCDHRLAAFQSITEDAYTSCPECGKETLRRLIGAGAGIIFKGSGFYETDYKRSRESSGPRRQESESSKPAETPAKKSSDSKSEKAES
ncbi:MAG: FmdB family zinc ribbon protein [Planctomycetota bacterium]|jgi:putative FmdB family regulatory protein